MDHPSKLWKLTPVAQFKQMCNSGLARLPL
jgi:hypothetical protein